MNIERQTTEVDIACVGFGPAMGGFLSTLSQGMNPENPLQVMCYERADDVGFGVSGVVTRARGIRHSFPNLDISSIPMAHPVKQEKVAYLLDPIGASRRPLGLKVADRLIRTASGVTRLPALKNDAVELPYLPEFMRKHDGVILSMGQFMQWVGSQVMSTGLVQVWPGTPVAESLIEGDSVVGVRLADQGVDLAGNPAEGYMPGMDVRAKLTVVGDGPVGAVSQQLDRTLGLPEGHHQRDWAVGMKMVIDLPADTPLEAGTVFHTFGYPEPEIFGFFYVHPNRVASVGILVPSFLESPIRTSYRYLQHWMQHPYLWRYLKGGVLRSWGAKSLQESGRRGEPFLAGNGYARIGESSGSTNVLNGSGVDEAWETGVQLAHGVLELSKEGKSFTRENLEAAYLKRRRESWLEKESRVAEKSRDGFHLGFLYGLLGMGLTGLSRGLIHVPGTAKPPHERIPSLETYLKGKVSEAELIELRRKASEGGLSLHDEVMNRLGWPEIELDGKLLLSHQDALLMGGKVQSPPGYANHVVFVSPEKCGKCVERVCIAICSGQAISANPGVPQFDREKCVHCGACLWNCSRAREGNPEFGNIDFRAGAGGLHSPEN